MKATSASCPVCKELLRYLPHADDLQVTCRRCGKFQVDNHVVRDLEGWKDEHLRKLSAHIRTSSANCDVKITKGKAKKIRSEFPNYSVEKKQRLLLELLRDKGDGVGKPVRLEPEFDWPAIWAQDGDEMIFHMKAMDDRNLIEIRQSSKNSSEGDVYYCCVTTKGWQKLQRTMSAADNASETDDVHVQEPHLHVTEDNREALDTKHQRQGHRSLPSLVQWIVAITTVLGVLVGTALAILGLV